MASLLVAAGSLAGPARGQPSGEPDRRGGAGRGLIDQMTAFKTDVPAHEMNVILARPTDRSILVTVALGSAGLPGDAIVEYWRPEASERTRTMPTPLRAGGVAQIELADLEPGAEYRYRVGVMHDAEMARLSWGGDSRFRTRPAPGTAFTFTVQADSHLDQGVEPGVYEQTLANMLAAKPDFVVDLGDTFMTDKRGQEFTRARAQYDAQRYYFGLVAHSAPLFMVLGNHDGEKGTSGRDADDIGPWSYVQRTGRFPAPVIDGAMYTGATALKDGVGSNYYAFEWGDALVVVLDPYWSTTERIRGGGGGNRAGGGGADPGRGRDEPLKPTDASWAMTLGRAQYDWLAETLSKADAHPGIRYRFVFVHHLVGGVGGAESRGGVESSGFFEWGGKNADGSPGFEANRPGWPMPIHDLLVRHRVSAVFHGHDHLYVHSQRDGVHYQCVPQPGNPAGNTRTAAPYGYASGVLFGSPGHVRVGVGGSGATVEFIRTAVQGQGAAEPRDGARRRERAAPAVNGAIVDSYTIAPATARR